MFTDFNVNLIQETPSQQQPDYYREYIDRNEYPGTVACDSEHRRGLREGTPTAQHRVNTPESDCLHVAPRAGPGRRREAP